MLLNIFKNPNLFNCRLIIYKKKMNSYQLFFEISVFSHHFY